MSAEEYVEQHFERQPDKEKGETSEYEYDDDAEKEATDRSETKAKLRKGKNKGKEVPIRNPRYARRYYGVRAECTVRQKILDKDGNQVGEVEEETIILEAEEQASGFEPAG